MSHKLSHHNFVLAGAIPVAIVFPMSSFSSQLLLCKYNSESDTVLQKRQLSYLMRKYKKLSKVKQHRKKKIKKTHQSMALNNFT